MELQIIKNPGELPSGLDKRVIFFANILAMFYGNEKETDVLQKEVGSLASYGSRLIPILDLLYKQSGNLLILESPPQEELITYFRECLGLTIPEIRVEPSNFYEALRHDRLGDCAQSDDFINQLKSFPAKWFDGYVTDSVLAKLAEQTNKSTISSLAGSHDGNNKFLLHQYLENNNLPTFETRIVTASKDVPSAMQDLQNCGYSQAVIKAQIGASGIGIQKFHLNGTIDSIKVPDYLFFEGPCLVQGWLDDSVEDVEYIGSPSVQMFLDEDRVYLYDITEQLLSADSVHEGNVAPPLYLENEETVVIDLLTQAEIAARWVHERGYRGTASADFHFIRRAGIDEIRICEINARVTGATYPSILARHFTPNAAWLLRNIRFSSGIDGQTILLALGDSGLLFKKGMDSGILPFNFNPNVKGEIVKGQFLFLEKTPHKAMALLKRMTELKALQGDYDRD